MKHHAIVFWLCLTLLLGSCAKKEGTTPGAKPPLSFGMITDIGGLGDKSFNDLGWEGLQRIGKELGITPKILQSTKQDDYVPNLGNMAQSTDVAIAIGFLFEDAMKSVADQYPHKKFGIIDMIVQKPNVMSIVFKEHEGSFLVGVITGLMTKSKVVGFVGGMEFPLIKKFEVGFRAGLAAINPEVKLLINYTGVFDNPDKGKEVAITQFKQGADVIYHASGACGIGVIQAADEQGFWAIGVDKDQSAESPKNRVLCSMVKGVDVATYSVIKACAENRFEGGKVVVFGVKDGGVGYSDNGKNVPENIRAEVEKYRQAIIAGSIVVPSTEAEYQTFRPVKL